MTRTPFLVASATSMLSMPTPARPMTFKFVAFANSSGVAYTIKGGRGDIYSSFMLCTHGSSGHVRYNHDEMT